MKKAYVDILWKRRNLRYEKEKNSRKYLKNYPPSEEKKARKLEK